ncbi:MAG: amino acid adenylation domain-containing protein [Pseudomonadota bacterium]
MLGLERVGRDDNFFELGGHSLMVVQVVGRMRQALEVEVDLRELFKQPTVAGFAALAEGARKSTSGAIGLADRSVALPLSFAQQRLWFLDQLDHAAGAAYHIPAALRLSGTLDKAALRATLERIVARHEILRTRFAGIDGQPAQLIAPADCGFALTEQDLAAVAPEQRQAQVEAISAAEAARAFDLAAGPLVRGQLLRLDDKEHILLLTQHHIISDGWSIGVLVREMSALYTAFCAGQADPLPALPIQYADYAAWQRAWLQGEVLQEQCAFWKNHLGGAPALLEMPTDRPRPAVQCHAGAGVALALTPELSAAVRALGQRHGTTLFMTLLAAWSLLLARVSGQDDVVIGTPVANRQRAETETLIGFFVNTLALRVRFDADLSVAQLLAQVKASTLDAYQHQDLPFDQVVEALQPARSMSYAPLFQAMLSMNNTPRGGGLGLSDLRIGAIDQVRTTAHFDLSLSLNDDGHAISGELNYATALFDQAGMERLVAQFQMLLGAMAADGAQAVARLELLGTQQRHQLLEQFNDNGADYPREQLVHALFEAQAAAQPHARALEYEGVGMSYAELNARANQLAHHLLAMGVKPDQRVAICLERGPDMIVALLGAMKAGAGYVPLDPAYPAERLAFMLGDSAPVAVLTQSSLAARLAPAATMVLLDADGDAIARHARANPDPATLGLNAGHLAYVIYTSGSTGRPKGVMVQHRSVINLWQGLARSAFLHVPAQARIGFNAAISFDASVKNIVQLLSGHCLVLIPQALRADALAMVAWFREQRIDMFDCTPSQLEAMCRAGMLADASFKQRVIVIGGEAIGAAAWQGLQQAGVRAYNVYGPTECTVDATIACIGEAGPLPHIGKPMPNVRIYILDSLLQPVPLGASGEIYIGGAGVARGYLNRAELTDERFLPDPFGGAGARMYRSGDLGRWQTDGSIAYLGRNDFQVKLRGYRIELGEIEAVLGACAGVREALVMAREDVPGDKRLVAYLTAREGAQVQVAQLRAQLLAALAEHMVPSAFVVLPAFPLTPNNKIDRKALPAPGQGAVVTREFCAPQGTLETVLAGIWQQLLGLERVGRDDHFFELGGHSLMAVQVLARLRQSLGLEAKLRDLFTHPVLSAFAAASAGAGRSIQGAIVAADRGAPLPLSFSQQRLWFLDQLDHASGAAFHMPAGLRLRGRLDQGALQGALDRIVARHESLRTTFARVDGQPVQVFGAPDCGFALRHQDLSALGGHEQSAAVTIAATDEMSAPFALDAGPLLRGCLLRLSDSEHVLLLTQHHIVSDGWSTGVLVRELGALYAALHTGAPDPLPPLPIQYADYAAWQRSWLSGAVLEAQLAFWSEHLGGAPALLELPTDRARPAAQSFAGARVEILLSPQLSEGVRALSARHGSTLFMTLLAAWGAVLARLSGQDDVVVGTPVANRQRAETEDLIGFFVNTLALRIRPHAHMSTAQLLAQVKDSTLAAFEHQDLPFDLVVDALRPVRSMSYGPLFQVMFSMNNTPAGEPLRLPGLELGALEQASAMCQFDLVLALSESGGQIGGTLGYATDLFDAATVERHARHFQTLLAAMVADEQCQLSALPLLDAFQRRQLLVDFNATDVAHVPGLLAHGLFEAQAEACPHAVALVFGDLQMSYAQVNRRANQVAHQLIAMGARPDARVAICLERGPELIIGLLGIMKAGAAYVPLDPAYPLERLRFMLSDSAPLALLTQADLAERLLADGPATPLLRLDADAALLAAHSGANPDPRALGLNERHLAYVIYTSGSTGQPKGVLNEHRALCNLIQTQRACYGVTRASRVLQFVSISFDVCISELTMALCNGAALVLAANADLQPGEPLLATVRRHRVSHLNLPSAVLAALAPQADLGQLHTLIVGGDALPAALADHWSARCTLFNAYGPTEAAVCTATHRCQAPHGRTVPIGRPTANTRIYLLDAHGEPVPVGVAGELHIGGVQVARGYLNRPELSAERFLDDPFSAVTGDRMYRTGDLARWLPDGSLDFVGRNDFQVKIRGFRIELGEIESALAACAGVGEAAVLARQDGPGEKRLVAYVVAHSGATLAPAALRDALAAQLPAHMVPAAVLLMDAFPRTPNGKLDRAALPAPDLSAAQERAYEAPQGEIENAIARIWQSLLGLARVGRQDSFFELGGHSLMAVQLMARIERELGCELGLRELFVHPTLQALGAAVGARAAGAPDRFHSLVPIRPDGILKPLFLVHPGEGEIGYARELAPRLDPALPVFGLAAQGFAAGETALASVEEMAACYVRQMRQVQPRGPYRVAGWSAGGTIAYEIANQLVGADEQVEFLGLIDTSSDYQALAGGVFSMRGTVVNDFEEWLAALAWLPADTLDAVRGRLRALTDVDAMLEHAQACAILPAGIGVPMLRRHLAVRHGIAVAMHAYEVPVIPVPVTLFAARAEQRADPSLGWSALLGARLRTVAVPGSHYSVMEPAHIGALGAAIDAELRGSSARVPDYAELRYSPKVAIQFGRAGVAPLFCVPGAGASVTAFTDLAQTIDPAIPVYGLQPRGLCGTLVPHVDVQSAARSYLRTVREVQPQGPYRLLGHSYGGWVVTEMARQLEAVGERVSTLVVLDSQAPAQPGAARKHYKRIDILMRLVGLFEEKLQGSLALEARDFAPLSRDAQLALLLERLIEVKLMPPRTRLQTLRGIVRAFGANINTSYVPERPYEGELHLAAASPVPGGRTVRASPDELIARWRGQAPKSKLWTSKGNHMTLLARPHVHELGKWLSPLMKEM